MVVSTKENVEAKKCDGWLQVVVSTEARAPTFELNLNLKHTRSHFDT
jgi:hypothetical protein